ncbi:MAG TPA: glycosyltransferase [Thermoleophilaceae bacterium]|jgi:GT2 family glycosyltransferase
MTSVAVLVPTWKRPEDLARCLHTLRLQRRSPDRVLVVRRPEDEASGRVLAAQASLPLEEVLVREPGQVAALNAGLDAVTEDVVAITDDDAAPRPDWIEQIECWFARDRQLGALGGRDWVYHGRELQDGAERRVGEVAWYGRFLSFHHLGTGTAREVDFLKGANMSFRREAIGPLRFNSELRGTGAEYLNDWGFTLAVKRRGWKVVYDPAVAIDHYEGSRNGVDSRSAEGRDAARVRAFNETYIAVRYLPASRALAHLLFAITVGSTVAPAFVLAATRVPSLGGPRAAAVEVGATLRARLGGALAGLRARLRES